MDNASSSNDDVTLIYIRLVRKESPDAAAVLEQIRSRFGAPAALRGALVITLLKQEIRHYHIHQDIENYIHLLNEYPDAMPLFSEAINFCLEKWTVSERDQRDWELWRQTLKTQSETLRKPYEYLLEQVRQHSPITAMKLGQIYRYYGVTVGGYAATTLVWVAARVDKFGDGIFEELTSARSIAEFSYFKIMRHDNEAINLFIDMIECYRTERRPASSTAFGAERDAFLREQQVNGREDHSQSASAHD